MKITVLKSSVETAFAPILKMAASAKSPIDFHPALTVRSDRHGIWLGCMLSDSFLETPMPDAVCDERNASFAVDLETFRGLLAAASRGTRLSIEQDAVRVAFSCDDRFIGQSAPIATKEDTNRFQIPKDADSTVLPTNFQNFLLQAFTCASDDKCRLALTGVNVSSRGIAGTDGRQLFHLPLPLQLKKDVTIPRSKVYAALKGLRWITLFHWSDSSGSRMFAIHGDEFRYVAKAIDTPYPNYSVLLPTTEKNDITVTLTPDVAQSLRSFLEESKDSAFAKLTVHPDRIELLETNGKDLTRRSGTFDARCGGKSLPCAVHFNPAFLRQFLKMGFLSLSFSSSKPASPLASSDGVGKYLFMPCGEHPADADVTPERKPEVKPEVISHSQPINPINPTNKTKEKTMSQTITTPTVATQTPSNPLDETLASITAMREQLSNLESRLLEAGRKIKAALIEQRQKERQYADATRKLERIRLAV